MSMQLPLHVGRAGGPPAGRGRNTAPVPSSQRLMELSWMSPATSMESSASNCRQEKRWCGGWPSRRGGGGTTGPLGWKMPTQGGGPVGCVRSQKRTVPSYEHDTRPVCPPIAPCRQRLPWPPRAATYRARAAAAASERSSPSESRSPLMPQRRVSGSVPGKNLVHLPRWWVATVSEQLTYRGTHGEPQPAECNGREKAAGCGGALAARQTP